MNLSSENISEMMSSERNSEKRSKERISEILRSMLKTQECSICFELLNNPVSIGCGHIFCRMCITELTRTTYRVSCPLCKKVFTRRSVQDAPQRCTIVERIRNIALKYRELTGTKFKQLNQEPDPLKVSTPPSNNTNAKQLNLVPRMRKVSGSETLTNGAKQSYDRNSIMQDIEIKSFKVVIPFEENAAPSLEQIKHQETLPNSDSDDSMPELPKLEISHFVECDENLKNASCKSGENKNGNMRKEESMSLVHSVVDKNNPEQSQKPYIVKTKGCRIHYGEKVENASKSTIQNKAATDPFDFIGSQVSPMSNKNKKRKGKWSVEKDIKTKRSAYGKIRVNALKNKTNNDDSEDNDFQTKIAEKSNRNDKNSVKAPTNSSLVVEASKENDNLFSTPTKSNENEDNTVLSNDVLPAILKKNKYNDYKSKKSKRAKKGDKRKNIVPSSSSAEEEISVWVKKLSEAENSKLNVEKVDREKRNSKEKVTCILPEIPIPSIECKDDNLKLPSDANSLDSSVSLQNASSPEVAEISRYSLSKSPGWSRLKQLNKDFHLREFSNLGIQTNTLAKSIIQSKITSFGNTGHVSGDNARTKNTSKSLTVTKRALRTKNKLNHTLHNNSLISCKSSKTTKPVSTLPNQISNDILPCEAALHCDSDTINVNKIVAASPIMRQISQLQSSNCDLLEKDDKQINYQTDHVNLTIPQESMIGSCQNSISNDIESSLPLKYKLTDAENDSNHENYNYMNSVENYSSKEVFPSGSIDSENKSQKRPESAVSVNQTEKPIYNNAANINFNSSASKKNSKPNSNDHTNMLTLQNSSENDAQIKIVECAKKVTEICSINDYSSDGHKSTNAALDFHPPIDAVREIKNAGREEWHFHEHSKCNYLRHLNADEIQYIEHSQQTSQSLFNANNHRIVFQNDPTSVNYDFMTPVCFNKNVPFHRQPFHPFCGNNDGKRKSNSPTERTKVIKRTCLTMEEIQDYFNKSYKSNSTEVICSLPFLSGDYHLQISVSDETLNVSVLKTLSSVAEANVSDRINFVQLSEVGVQTSDDQPISLSPAIIAESSNSEHLMQNSPTDNSIHAPLKCDEPFPFLSDTNLSPTVLHKPDIPPSSSAANALELTEKEDDNKEKLPTTSSVLKYHNLIEKENLEDDEIDVVFETSSQSSIISNQEIFSSKKESEDREIICTSPSSSPVKATGRAKEKAKDCIFSAAAVKINEQSFKNKIDSNIKSNARKNIKCDFEKMSISSSSDEFYPFEKDSLFYRSTPVSQKRHGDLRNIIQCSENLSSDPDMAFATDLVAPLKDMAQKLQLEENESGKMGVHLKHSRLSLPRLRRKPLSDKSKHDIFEKNTPKAIVSTQSKFKRIKCMDSSDESDNDKSQSICESKRYSDCEEDLEEIDKTLVIHSNKSLVDDNEMNTSSAMVKIQKNIQHDLNLVSANQREEEITYPDKNSTAISDSSIEAPSQIKMEIDELGEHIKMLEEKLKQKCAKETVAETKDELKETDQLKDEFDDDGFDGEGLDLGDSSYSEEMLTIPPTPPESIGNPNEANYNLLFYKRFGTERF